MEYKLIANEDDINTLKTKYKITKFLFNNYIELELNDISKLQELLNKQVLITHMQITVLY